MKIAVPTNNMVVDNHFGHCEYFTVFTIENNKIANQQKVNSDQGCGCKSDIIPILKAEGVDTMLVGNLGQGAINKIVNADIRLVRGCSGDVTRLVNEYLAGNVTDALTICHEHGDGSGEHQCNH